MAMIAQTHSQTLVIVILSVLLAPAVVATELQFNVLVSDDEADGQGGIFQVLEGPAAIDNTGNVYFQSTNGAADNFFPPTGIWRVGLDGLRTRIISENLLAPDIFNNGAQDDLSGLRFSSSSTAGLLHAVVAEDGTIYFPAARFSDVNLLFRRKPDATLENIARDANTAAIPANNETTAADGINYADSRGNVIRGFAQDDGSNTLRANTAGNFAFQGNVFGFNITSSVDAGLIPKGIFTGADRSTTRAVAFIGTQANSTLQTWTQLSLLAIAADGSVFFKGELSDGNQGIWVDRNGVIDLVVKTGGAAPGSNDGRQFAALAGSIDSKEISINAQGELALLGLLVDPAGLINDQLVIWHGAADNLQARVIGSADSVSSLSGSSGAINAIFNPVSNRFEGILISDNGDILFSAQYDDADQSGTQQIDGVFRLPNGQNQLTQIQSGSQKFFLGGINDLGQAVFKSGATLGTLFAFDPTAGVTQVFTRGTVTSFGTIESFEIVDFSNGGSSGASTSFNDFGQLAVAVSAEGGTTGIDEIVRVDITFQTLVDNVFRFSGGCGDLNWHSGCADTNWVDSADNPQDRQPGDAGNANVLIEQDIVTLADRPAIVESITVTPGAGLIVQQPLTVRGNANIANLVLEAAFTAQGETNLTNPVIRADVETALNSRFRINGTSGVWQDGKFTGVSTVEIDPDARLALGGDVVLGTALVNNGAFDIGANNLRLDINAAFANNATLLLGDGSSITNFDTNLPSFFTNNGLIQKTGPGAATIVSDFTQTERNTILIMDGSLTISQGAFDIAGAFNIDDGASLVLQPKAGTPAMLRLVTATGKGKLVLKGGSYELVPDSLGNGEVSFFLGSAAGKGGLVLDNIESIKGNGNDLAINQVPGQQVRLLKQGQADTSIESLGKFTANARIEASAGQLSIAADTIVLNRSSFSGSNNGSFSLAAAIDARIFNQNTFDGTAPSTFALPGLQFDAGAQLISSGDLTLLLTQTGLMQGASGKATIAVSEGGRLTISGSLTPALTNINLTTGGGDLPICGVICLASTSAGIAIRPAAAQAVGGTLILDSNTIVDQAFIRNISGGVIRIDRDLLLDTTNIVNDENAVFEISAGTGLIGGPNAGVFFNDGEINSTGGYDFDMILSGDSTGTVRARHSSDTGFSTVSFRTVSKFSEVVVENSVVGNWDIENVHLSVVGIPPEISTITSGQSIRLAGDTQFFGLEKQLTTTASPEVFHILPGGSLFYDDLKTDIGANVIDVRGSLRLRNTSIASFSALRPLEINVFEGGVLQSDDALGGAVLNRGGSVIVGSSPGTLTINGDYTQSAAGVLSLELGGLQAGVDYDQLIVNGTASFSADSVIEITLLDDGSGLFMPRTGDRFDLLVADNLISDGPLEDLLRLKNAPTGLRFNFEQLQSADGILLQLAAIFGSQLSQIPGLDASTTSIAQTLDAISLQSTNVGVSDLALAIDALPNTAEKQRALTSLNHRFSTALFDFGRIAHQGRRAALSRLIRGADPVEPIAGRFASNYQGVSQRAQNRSDIIQLAQHLDNNGSHHRWSDRVVSMLDVQVNQASFDGSSGQDNVDFDGVSVNAGVAVAGRRLQWGVLAQIGNYSGDADSEGDLDFDDWSVTGYIGTHIGEHHRLQLSYGYGEYQVNMKRASAIGLAGTRMLSRANVDAQYYDASLAYTGYFNSLHSGPQLELTYFRVDVDDFSETGSTAALAVMGDNYNHTAARVGWRFDNRHSSERVWKFYAGAYYQRFLAQNYNNLEANFIDSPDLPFTIVQDERDDGAINLDAGIALHTSEQLDLFLDLDYWLAGDFKAGSLRAGLLYQF